MSPARGRQGATFGNVLLVVAAVALGAAIVAPLVQRLGFHRRVREVAEEVRLFRGAALAYRDEGGLWPSATGRPGEVPRGLGEKLPVGWRAEGGSYSLQWRRWIAVRYIEAEISERELAALLEDPEAEIPQPTPEYYALGGITVRSAEAPLLAALDAAFPADVSFLTDSTWTLLLPGSGTLRGDSIAQLAPTPTP